MKKALTILFTLTLAVAASAKGWAPAGDLIKTKWAEEVNPAATLPEYPRPQMVRSEWVNLNGLWDYAITSEGAEYAKADGKILVPFAVESSLSGVQRNVGDNNALWYERTFTVPSSWKGKDVLLHFGAVDWQSEVWVNGQSIGVHTGGFTPFTYNITPYLRKGKQTIRIRVWDATDNGYQPRGKQVGCACGIWYTPVTGIWQTVWMEPVAKTHIENYYVVSDLAAATLNVEVNAADVQEGDKIVVELLEGGEGYSAEKPASKVIASSEVCCGKAVVAVPEVKTWSPDSPYLYGLNIKILRKGKVVDSVNGYTAMRSVAKHKVPRAERSPYTNYYNRITLNGTPLFQFGPLDQGWWPDGLYTAPTDEALRFDIEKTKEMGFNMIRKHIKVEPARWYYWCDVLGMMVWQDMPSIGDHSKRDVETRSEEVHNNTHNHWSSDSLLGGTDAIIPEEWQANYYKEWTEIIEAVKFFQSIVVWVPFNEAWGQFNTPAAVELTRKLDSTRLVNESSGGNYSLCGDILDVHHYPQPAMNVFEGKMINVIGEYGGIGYVIPGHTWKQDKNWGYNGLCKDSEEVVALYRKYAEILKPFVAMGCSAAVYTQTTDVEVEVNGLMTYDRIMKVDPAAIREINEGVIASMTE